MTRRLFGPVDILNRGTRAMSLSRRGVVGRWTAAVLVSVVAGSTASTAMAVVPPFDILDFSARALDDVGDDYTVAGGHPHGVEVSFRIPADPDFLGDVEFIKSTF